MGTQNSFALTDGQSVLQLPLVYAKPTGHPTCVGCVFRDEIPLESCDNILCRATERLDARNVIWVKGPAQ